MTAPSAIPLFSLSVIAGHSVTGLLEPRAGFDKAAPAETCASAQGAPPSQQAASKTTAHIALERAISNLIKAVAFSRK